MVAKTDQKARLFDLWGSVVELVRGDKRDAESVAKVLQVIKDEQDFERQLFPTLAVSADTKPPPQDLAEVLPGGLGNQEGLLQPCHSRPAAQLQPASGDVGGDDGQEDRRKDARADECLRLR